MRLILSIVSKNLI